MRTLLALSALIPLAACTTAGDRYPSLAIRDVERAQGQFEPAPVTPIVVPEVALPTDAPLAEQIAAASAEAEAAHRAFLASSARAQRIVDAAAGAAIASPAWAEAQVALADLDSARSRTAVALADLDTLMVANAVQAEATNAIETARQQVIALVEAEDATLARLRGRIR